MTVSDLAEDPIDELRAARERMGLPPEGPDRPAGNERSFADRASDIDLDEDDENPGELFVLEHGRKVTLSQLIPRGALVEYRVNLNSKSFKGGPDMGLLSYGDPDILLVVPARQGKVVPDATYDERGNLEKVVIYVNFKPLTVHEASSAEGQALLEA